MNCKQAETLLPLYAGCELDEKRAALVTEHLQRCAACSFVADEYRASVQLTEKFAPPVFSEAVYAGIRQRVMREIEAEAMAPAWSQTIANFLRPRLTWAVAGVLLIVVSMFAIYFIVNRGNDKQHLADKPPAKVKPGTEEGSNSGPQRDERAELPNSVNTNGKEQQMADAPRPQRRRSRDMLTDSLKTNGATSLDATFTANNISPQPNNLTESKVDTPRDPAALGKTLRVEIQTKDPNIRIIWFAQQEIKSTIPSSKGI